MLLSLHLARPWLGTHRLGHMDSAEPGCSTRLAPSLLRLKLPALQPYNASCPALPAVHHLLSCSLVVLSGRDDLVPTELVRAHIKLTGHPAKVCAGWPARGVVGWSQGFASWVDKFGVLHSGRAHPPSCSTTADTAANS